MNTEERISDDESTEVPDTGKTNDLSVEEQNDDVKANQESLAGQVDGDSPPNGNGGDSQTETQPISEEQIGGDSPPNGNGGDSQTETQPIEIAEPEPPSSERDPEYMKVLISVDEHLSNLQQLFAQQIAGNQNQKEMFDKIYIEMKAYKENTLMEAFHKPIADNLIRFYDNLVWVESELNSIIKITEPLEALFEGPSEGKVRDFFWKHLKKTQTKESVAELLQSREELGKELSQFQENLENVRVRLEEVLFRMNVKPYEAQPYAKQAIKLDTELHRTVETVDTDKPEQDFIIKELHKKGFLWREKVLRPEEVVIYRYKPRVDESKEAVGENPTDQEGDKADG